MVVLTYPPEHARVRAWASRLEELVVAHRLVCHAEIAQPEITFGERRIIGAAEIERFLPELARELAAWRDDSCGG